MEPLESEILYHLKGEVYTQFKTIKEFGEAIGYGQSRISSIINGKAHPSAVFQRRAAKALGLTMGEFRKVLTGRRRS